MIYEIREYTTVPGMMPALVQRFKEHGFAAFKRHGVEVVFISLTSLGAVSNNELVYVVRFDSYQEMADKWGALNTDAEWLAARKASEENGAIVATLSRRVLDPSPFL